MAQSMATGDKAKSETLPQHTVSIGNVPKRKVPAKSASFSIMRSRRDDGDKSPLLPDRSPEAMRSYSNSNNKQQPPLSPMRTAYRAAERGKLTLLPMSASSNNMTHASASVNGNSWPNRTRASSTNSFAATNHNNHRSKSTPSEQLQQMTQSLRSRKRSGGSNNWVAMASDDENNMHSFASPASYNRQSQHQQQQQRSLKPSWSDTFGKTDKPLRRQRDFVMCLARSTVTIKRAHVFQALITCLVTFFVYDSYQKAIATTEQLLIVKHEESMMMLHLKRLEEHSLQLHEAMARLAQGGAEGVPREQNELQNQHGNGNGGSDSLDGEIIKIQTKQLREMEDELDHEVKSLQTKIQTSDSESIVRTFGEGPVQVILDVSLPQQQQELKSNNNKISILLWYDTPHAAWTLIDQLNKGLWNDSVFRLDKNVAITLEPPHSETLKKIDFVEKGQKKHAPWTVGLAETSQGGLGLFINLQDNMQYHKHDVCIGKVIDGFDTLQRLIRIVRSNEVVTIRKASAAHLTMKESAGLS
jgi:cyclophilin family peptidyl-prolyl cis-trans isomerase